MICQVVNLNSSSYDVYIGRPSKWGNPFSHKNGTLAKFKTSTRKESLTKYRQWIREQVDLMRDLPELKGKKLGCFCKPKTCHGDILVEMVNNLDVPDLL